MGYVDGFTKIRGNNNQLKNTLFSPEVKGEIAYGNSHGFQAQTEDLHLKTCILGYNPKTKEGR
jgi:hypothetical protein